MAQRTKKELGIIAEMEKTGPKCRKCGNEPQWPIKSRSTGKWSYFPLGKECENARQKIGRARRKARDTKLADLQLGNGPTKVLAAAGFELVRDVEKLDEFPKGFGPKSQAKLATFLKENDLS